MTRDQNLVIVSAAIVGSIVLPLLLPVFAAAFLDALIAEKQREDNQCRIKK
jgi:hypothetical protein